MKALRIAFVANEFVTEKHFYGGLANYIHRTTKELVSLGHEVHVVTHSEIDEAEFDYNGIRVHRISLLSMPIWLRLFGGYKVEGSVSQRVYFNIQVYRKLKEIHAKTPLDIVQFTNVYASGLLPGLLLRIPHVTRMSSYRPLWNRLDRRKRDLNHKFHEWFEWLQLRLSKHIYASSHKMKEILAQEMTIKHVKVVRPPAYIETEMLDPSLYQTILKDKDYLLFFGRLQIRKGFHVLAEAIPAFLKDHPDAYVVCVGSDYRTEIAPSMREYARWLCKDRAERLIFIDQKSHKELYPIISGAKVVVLPSLVENLSNACLEAMLLGKATVGTLEASFEELITDGENGFLARAGDAGSLTAKIDEAWRHPELDRIGDAAARKMQELTPERTVRKLLEYYKEAIGDKDGES